MLLLRKSALGSVLILAPGRDLHHLSSERASGDFNLTREGERRVRTCLSSLTSGGSRKGLAEAGGPKGRRKFSSPISRSSLARFAGSTKKPSSLPLAAPAASSPPNEAFSRVSLELLCSLPSFSTRSASPPPASGGVGKSTSSTTRSLGSFPPRTAATISRISSCDLPLRLAPPADCRYSASTRSDVPMSSTRWETSFWDHALSGSAMTSVGSSRDGAPRSLPRPDPVARPLASGLALGGGLCFPGNNISGKIVKHRKRGSEDGFARVFYTKRSGGWWGDARSKIGWLS